VAAECSSRAEMEVSPLAKEVFDAFLPWKNSCLIQTNCDHHRHFVPFLWMLDAADQVVVVIHVSAFLYQDKTTLPFDLVVQTDLPASGLTLEHCPSRKVEASEALKTVVECSAGAGVDCPHPCVAAYFEVAKVVEHWVTMVVENLPASQGVLSVLYHEVALGRLALRLVSGLLVANVASHCLLDTAMVSCD